MSLQGQTPTPPKEAKKILGVNPTKPSIGMAVVIALLVLSPVAYFFFHNFFVGKSKVAPEVLDKAYSLNNIGNYKAAEAYLSNEIKKNPDVFLKLSLANSILDEGSVRGTEAVAAKKARDILSKLEDTENSVPLYDLLGYSFEIENNFDKALEYYNKALKIDGKSADTLFSIGHTYWLKGDLKKSQEFYNKAEAAVNESTPNAVKVKIATALGTMETDPKKAEEYYLKVLPMTDSKVFKAEIYSNLSVSRFTQNDTAKAIEYANLAIETDPSNELGYLAYARTAISDKTLLQDNLSKVEEYLFKTIFLAPRKAEAQYLQGKFDAIIGNYDAALKSYATARKIVQYDNSVSPAAKDGFKADVLFDEAVTYYLLKDTRYKSYIREAFKFNPVKVFSRLDKETQYNDLRTALIEGNLFMMAKTKPRH